MANKTLSKHEMLFFVYVLGSQRKNDRRTYVGWTTDLERRLRQHNAGVGAKSTRGRKWVLLYSERCKTRSEAMSREWNIKHDRSFAPICVQLFEPDEACGGAKQWSEVRSHDFGGSPIGLRAMPCGPR
jgi:putative endonuclease